VILKREHPEMFNMMSIIYEEKLSAYIDSTKTEEVN